MEYREKSSELRSKKEQAQILHYACEPSSLVKAIEFIRDNPKTEQLAQGRCIERLEVRMMSKEVDGVDSLDQPSSNHDTAEFTPELQIQ